MWKNAKASFSLSLNVEHLERESIFKFQNQSMETQGGESMKKGRQPMEKRGDHFLWKQMRSEAKERCYKGRRRQGDIKSLGNAQSIIRQILLLLDAFIFTSQTLFSWRISCFKTFLYSLVHDWCQIVGTRNLVNLSLPIVAALSTIA